MFTTVVILIALRAVRRARVEYALGKREEGKREEGKREEGAVGQFGCHLGAIWAVIWEPFGESFGASFGSHFPPPWEVPNSYFVPFNLAPLPEPTPPYLVAKTAPKRGAPKVGLGDVLVGAVWAGKLPGSAPPMRAIRTQKTARMGGWGSWVMSHES